MGLKPAPLTLNAKLPTPVNNSTEFIHSFSGSAQPRRQSQKLAQLAFPDDQHSPSELAQPPLVDHVSPLVLLQLGPPEVEPRLRPSRILTCSMPMPEAPVHEDDLASAGKHQVRVPWQVAGVQPVPIPHAVDETPDQHLRLRVLSSDQAHPLAALGGRQGS